MHIAIQYDGVDVHLGFFNTFYEVLERIHRLRMEQGGDIEDYNLRFVPISRIGKDQLSSPLLQSLIR